MDTIKRLQKNVTLIRVSKQMTQDQLAKKAKVAPSTVSFIEAAGTPNIGITTVEKIATALGVSPSDLLYKNIELF